LNACSRLAVLATSRARLLVPYEWVFAVPGLSVSDDVGGLGDGVYLFLQRASAAGSTPAAADYGRVAVICRGLDGMALAIELAAARLPALGLDGLEAGLADRLELLAGGSMTGTVPCGRRWTGASRSWTAPARRCCDGFRCSPRRSPPRTPRQ
jgi:predicted ATPase